MKYMRRTFHILSLRGWLTSRSITVTKAGEDALFEALQRNGYLIDLAHAEVVFDAASYGDAHVTVVQKAATLEPLLVLIASVEGEVK